MRIRDNIDEEIAEITAAIPQNITHLTFDSAMNVRKTGLLSLIKAIPSGVKCFTLESTSPLSHNTCLQHLPKNVETAVLGNRYYGPYPMRIEQLVNNLISRHALTVPQFQSIVIPEWVSQEQVNEMIAQGKSKADPLALITCGLLLEGTIKYNGSPSSATEQSIHAAINCYEVKMYENNPKYQTLIHLLLAKIKEEYAYPSVQERLNSYTFTPSENLGSNLHFIEPKPNRSTFFTTDCSSKTADIPAAAATAVM